VSYKRATQNAATFNKGVRHGIRHAVLVLRAALRGEDDGQGRMAHRDLERLRRRLINIDNRP
jgi:hypothetical protein